MKIVWTDNFNRETISEKLVAAGLNQEQGEALLKELQHLCTERGPNWYKLTDESYEPYRFEP